MTVDGRPARSAEAGRITLILDGADVPEQCADLIATADTYEVRGTLTRMIAAMVDLALRHGIADGMEAGTLDGEVVVQPQRDEEVTLDDLRSAGVAAWKRWRAEHPDVALFVREGDTSEAMDALLDSIVECVRTVVPRDDVTLRRLAVNEELWSIELDGCEPTLGTTVAMALEKVVEGHIDSLIRSGELS